MRDIGNVKLVTGAELALVLADNTVITVDSEHISMNGIVLDDSTSVDGKFTIGAAVTGQLTITILNEDGAYSDYNFRGATGQLTFLGVEELPDDEDEEIQESSLVIGQYNIVDYTYDGSDITLTAYDNLCKFDIPCTESNGKTPPSFPIPMVDLVQKAVEICGVDLLHPTNPIPDPVTGGYSIAKKPEQWGTMTWHDVISYCAQLAGVYAKVDKNGKLYFDWYNITSLGQEYDGGTFDTEDTPYSDGAELDGGDFTYTTADSADGGDFNYPADMHFVPSPYALTVATDDVCITGLKVILAASDDIQADENTTDFTTDLYGEDGYVITISGNPLIQTRQQAVAIRDFLGDIVVGMWFRPLNATIDDDLTLEAGDQVYVTGTDGSTYQCFVSHVTYTTNAATTFACDAEASSSNQKTRFTAADKTAAHIEQIQQRVERVAGIAGNTNQYFWHTQEGTDTGVHITEKTQEEFLADPDNGGSNLLARSNGIAIRDGLTELAQFGTTVILGDPASTHVEMDSDSLELYNSIPTRCLTISASESQVTVPVIVSDNPSPAFDTSSDTPATLSVSGTWDNMPTDSATFELLRVQIAYWFYFIVDSHRITYSDTQWITLVNGVGSYTVTKKFGNYAHDHNRTLTITYDAATKQITASITQAVFFEVFGNAYETNITSPAPAMLFGSLAPGGAIGGYSAVLGGNLNSAGDYQTVLGKWNSSSSNHVLEIGNGTSESARSNAVTVDWDGNIVSNATPTSGSLTSPITNGSVYRNVCTKKGDLVNVAYHRASFTARNPSSVIATLPAGFRPKVAQYIPGIVYTTEWVPTTMVVATNGEISAAYAPATTCTHAQIVGTFFI